MLRTPPLSQLLIRLQNRLDSLSTADIAYDSTHSAQEAFDDLYDRVGVIVDDGGGGDDPPPETAISEDFDLGNDGDEITIDTTTASFVTGSGSLLLSSNFAVVGDSSLHIDGSSIHFATWQRPIAVGYKAKFYGKHERTPSATGWVAYVYAGDTTTVAARIGITSGGFVTFQDGTSGTADTAGTALAPGDIFKGELTMVAGTSGRLAIYGPTAVNNESEVGALDVLTIPQTQIAYTNTSLGLLNALASGGAVVGDQTNEGFEGGTNAVAPTTSTISATSITGSGSLTVSTLYAKEGTKGLRVHGLNSHIAAWAWPSRVKHAQSYYFKYLGTGDGNTYFWGLKNGPNTLVACQLGVGADDKLRLRDSTTGTAVLASSAMSVGTVYRFDTVGDPSVTNKVQVLVYTGANEDTTSSPTWTINLTVLTATSFSTEQHGMISTSGTVAHDFVIDRIRSDSSTLPTPVGVSAGTGLGLFLDHWYATPDTMPASVHVNTGGGGGSAVSDLLVPNEGCWWGCTCPPNTGSGSTAAGLDIWRAFAQREPDIIKFYMSNANWNGILTAAQKALLNPTDGTSRKIGAFNWKLSPSGLTMAEIAAGGLDSNLTTWCNGIKQYPWKIFLAPQHEFDNQATADGTPNSRPNYKAMFRHVYNHIINVQHVTNVVFVWNVTGFSSQAGVNGANWEAMYPGDDLDFWIAPDPYFSTTSRPTLAELLNIVSPPVSGYPGFYDWAQTNHPGKPIMLGEWSVHVDDITDSFGAGQVASIGDLITDYPAVKAMIQWNGAAANVSRLQNHPLIDAAFAEVGAMSYFNVGTENAP